MKSIARALWKNDFSRGGIFLTISSFGANFLGYLFNSLAGRVLGPSGYGEIMALFSYSYITAVPFTVFSTIIIQKIASSSLGIGYAHALETWFFEKVNKIWFLGIISFLFIPLIARITNLGTVSILVLILMIFLSFLSSFYTASIQGMRLFVSVAILALLGALIKLVGPIAVLNHVDGLLTIYFFVLLSSATGLIIGYWALHHTIKKTTESKREKIDKRLISLLSSRQFLLTTASVLAITLFSNIDIIFVKKFFSSTDAGIYSSWSLFSKIILYALTPLMQVSFVFFASPQTGKRQQHTLIASLIGLIIVGIAAYITYQFWGNIVVATFFGNKFYLVIPYMGYAALFGSFYAAIFYLNNFFLAKNSKAALILFLAVPLYIFLLSTVDKHIISIMRLNIFFAISVSLLYLSVFAVRLVRKNYGD